MIHPSPREPLPKGVIVGTKTSTVTPDRAGAGAVQGKLLFRLKSGLSCRVFARRGSRIVPEAGSNSAVEGDGADQDDEQAQFGTPHLTVGGCSGSLSMPSPVLLVIAHVGNDQFCWCHDADPIHVGICAG